MHLAPGAKMRQVANPETGLESTIRKGGPGIERMEDAWESPHAPDGDHTDFHPWTDANGDGWTNLEEPQHGGQDRLPQAARRAGRGPVNISTAPTRPSETTLWR